MQWAVLARLVPFLWPAGDLAARVRTVLAFLCLAGSIGAGSVVPFLLKYVVEELGREAGPVVAVAIGLVLAYTAVRAMQTILQQLRDVAFAVVGQRVARRLVGAVFQHLHRLSYRFHTERQTGGLQRVIDRGGKSVGTLLSMVLFSIVPSVGYVLVFSVVLVVEFDWTYTLALLGSVLAYVALTFRVTEWRIGIRRKMNQRDENANTRAIDSLLNYETVKYFGNEAEEFDRFDQAQAKYESAAVRSELTLAVLNIGQTLVIAVGTALVLMLATYDVAGGGITVGDFVAINAMAMQVFMPLGMLGWVYREVKQSLADMEKVFALLDQAPDIVDRPDAPVMQVRGGHVEFRDVDFAYDSRRQVLHGVNFAIDGGKTLAVVGETGGGKSTITRLLFRFLEPSAGQVLIDGQDISRVQQASLRAALGMVPQDVVLFNDTLAQNIRYGNLTATDAEVEQVVAAAQLTDLVSRLPDGLETPVGERGLKLSGGEKQRVAIARMLMKNPPVLVFDEATSALDVATEKEIQAALRTASAGRTTIVIAHRLSTVMHADQILVLHQGHVVERGTHTDLVARDGRYAAMWARQQSEQQSGDSSPDAAKSTEPERQSA